MTVDNSINPNTLSLSYADRLWHSWRKDPDSVPQAWRDWFDAKGGISPAASGYRTSDDAAERDLADQNKVDRLRITLIDCHSYHLFQPLLSQVATPATQREAGDYQSMRLISGMCTCLPFSDFSNVLQMNSLEGLR